MKRIPFNKPAIAGKELEYVQDCIIKGHTSGDGAYSRKVVGHFKELFGEEYSVFLTPSGTAALELATLALGIGPGDEVIMPSFTFVSTANAVILHGARPVFADIRSDTLNIDENQIETLITPQTKAILPVHYAGVGCEMDQISQIAEKNGLFVIEDAAHALYSRFDDKALGGIGDAGCFSFHETKNFICGEGGATVFKNKELGDKATIMREKGTNRSAFLKGFVDKYTWVAPGSSYLLSDILAAFLWGQLEQKDSITKKRAEIHQRYYQGLKDLESKGHVTLPRCPERCTPNYHIFYLITESLKTRDALIEHLNQANISAVFHYIPLHSSPFGKNFHKGRNLPLTDKISQTILRLPVFYDLEIGEQERIIDSIRSFFE